MLWNAAVQREYLRENAPEGQNAARRDGERT